MKLCIGFEIQIRSVYRLTNHAGRHCGIGWCGIIDCRYLLIGVSFYIQLLFFGYIILIYITKHMFANAFEESFE